MKLRRRQSFLVPNPSNGKPIKLSWCRHVNEPQSEADLTAIREP